MREGYTGTTIPPGTCKQQPSAKAAVSAASSAGVRGLVAEQEAEELLIRLPAAKAALRGLTRGFDDAGFGGVGVAVAPRFNVANEAVIENGDVHDGFLG